MNAALKPRVLCIDDEPHIVRSLQWLLQKDFQVDTCTGAVEAVRLIRANDYDVVVSDQRMPEITGAELLRHVRRFSPRSMRILLTGYSDLDAMMKSVNESEVYRFVTKPWDVRTLPRVIAEAALAARECPAPAAEPEAVAANDAEAAKPAEAGGPEGTLLVLDEDAGMHEAIEAAMGGHAECVHASDLAEALAILDARPVSAIVSELSVRGADASRLLRLIKAVHPQIVTLVLSERRDAETVMRLINEGQVYRIIPKPAKPGFIRLLVLAAFKRHRELLAQPAMRRRFAVQAAPEEVAQALYRDVLASAQPRTPPGGGTRDAEAHGPEGGGMVEALRAGFRRLFGT